MVVWRHQGALLSHHCLLKAGFTASHPLVACGDAGLHCCSTRNNGRPLEWKNKGQFHFKKNKEIKWKQNVKLTLWMLYKKMWDRPIAAAYFHTSGLWLIRPQVHYSKICHKRMSSKVKLQTKLSVCGLMRSWGCSPVAHLWAACSGLQKCTLSHNFRECSCEGGKMGTAYGPYKVLI